MLAPVPLAVGEETAGDLRRRFASETYAARDLVVVVDAAGRYAGAAVLADLLLAGDDARVCDHVDAEWPCVGDRTDQEHAAETAGRTGAIPLVVVDFERRPLGCIPADQLLSVLEREHREDVHRLVGILEERDGARHALDDPPVDRVRRRLPWLLVGLAMSAAGTALMVSFEGMLKAHVAITFFIPALVYLTDAIGTQSEAIAVRGLSLERRPLAAVLTGEIVTGALIGLVLGVLAFVGVLASFGDVRLAIGAAISLFVAGTLASGLGLLLPWLLSRFGVDPAFGSGPVATIIQDVATMFVYFSVMSWLL